MAHMKRNLGRALAGTLILSLVGIGTLALATGSYRVAPEYNVPYLGHGRAAGQWRRARALARQVREH